MFLCASVVCPDGRVVGYEYGAAGGVDDVLNRVQSVHDEDLTVLAEFRYLGPAMPTVTTLPEPSVERRWKKLPGQPNGDAGDPYTGYDRFGRTEQMLWRSTSVPPVTTPLVHVQWGYDRASLKTWRKDLLAPASTGQDQHFGYDGLYQVTQRQRGLLNVNTTAIGGVPAQQEGFGYDETGNWVSYRQVNAGEVDIDQSRVNNRSNQIAQVDGSSAGVSYDRNGNMLMMPTGEGLTGPSKKLVWDAWNRLREVRDAEDTLIASYQYDAATRRTVEVTGEGEAAVTRHFYYNDQWRSVEERLDASTEPERQQVWHPADRYELLLRDRSTENDGDLDERLYPMKDQLDPVALCDANGTVVERYAYSAFGMTTFLNPSFIPQPSSLVAWNFLFHAEFSDPQTGWFNYGYRYYLPELGRWPSRDPIGERGGVNIYRSLANAPLTSVDLLGLIQPGTDLGDGPYSYTRPEYNKIGRPNLGESEQLDRGCIGLVCAVQGLNPRTGKYMPSPENYPGTKCYLTEPKASDACKNCPKGYRGRVFAKQGTWPGRFPTPPKENRNDHTIPSDYLVPVSNGLTRGGAFNYIAKFANGTYGGANNEAGDPAHPQEFWFDDSPPGTSPGYPHEMWCCSCVPCGRDEK